MAESAQLLVPQYDTGTKRCFVSDPDDGTTPPDSVPFAEFCIIHRFTLRSGSSYTQLGKVRIEAYKDLRGKTTRVSVQLGVV